MLDSTLSRSLFLFCLFVISLSPWSLTHADPCPKLDGTAPEIDKLEAQVSGLNQTVKSETDGPFIWALRQKIENPRFEIPPPLSTNRGLVQMPLDAENPNQGPCGSWHYNSDEPPGIDSYTKPLSACVLTALLQEWKLTACPHGDEGCRIQWGDISHRDQLRWNGHKTHTQGECIDFRAPRKGAFEDSPLLYTSPNYDHDKTRQFIEMARKFGASNILFGDTKIPGVTYNAGHKDHIHLCFHNNPTTQNTCQKFSLDEKVCPELGK